MDSEQFALSVIGAGSWGTALAISLSRQGRPILLWDRSAEHITTLDSVRCNLRYLPSISLPDSLHVTQDLAYAVAQAQDLLIAVPSHAFRATLQSIQSHIRPEQRIVWATKGFESGSGKLLHEVVEDVFGGGRPYAVLSGPTFATEVAEGLPTAVSLASRDEGFAQELSKLLHTQAFRVYTSTDVNGVEVGGAVKNVLAIAAGIADGLGFGANTRAALITRGLMEMSRLGIALGGQSETFTGLAGLGDLVLTCTDNQSRNRRLGLALGAGKSVEQALASINQVVEGVQTAREVHDLAISHGVDMPITTQVYRVLYQDITPRQAVHALLERHQKPEV